MVEVLIPGEQVLPGARNWVCVKCARQDMHLGTYSMRHCVAPGFSSTMSLRYYGVTLPSLLFVTNGVCFCVLNCILGGQALASIANISWT